MTATDLFDVSGHVALITGASQGVGRAIAQGLGEAGACIALSIIMISTLSQFGCSANSGVGQGHIASSSSVSISEEVKERFGTIGVTTVRLKSEQKPIDTAGMARGALDGAMTLGNEGLKGGLEVAGGALVLARVLCIVPTPVCLAGLAPLAVGVAAPVVGVVSGAIGGALLAESGETIEKSATAINDAVAAEPLGDTISDEIVETLKRNRAKAVRMPDHSVSFRVREKVPDQTADTLLSTELTELWLSPAPKEKAGINPAFQLSMTIESRLQRKYDGLELSSRSVSYQSNGHPLTRWAANDAKLLREELRTASRRMAEEMVDSLVLLYPKEVEPLMPQDGAQVGTLKPTLGWVPFPTPTNGPADHNAVASPMRNTEYELRVLHGGTIVYQRIGLNKVIHKVDDSLPVCKDLQWLVRARFDLKGSRRVSRWSGAQSFKTPCYGEPSTWAKRNRRSERGDSGQVQ